MMSIPFEQIGAFLATFGAMLSVAGSLVNNLKHDHRGAMKIWMVSNPMLLAWACGYIMQLWDGGLSVAALAGMYFVFTTTNFYGLWKEEVKKFVASSMEWALCRIQYLRKKYHVD